MFEILPPETRPFINDSAFRQIMMHPRFAALLKRAEEADPVNSEELHTFATDAVFDECMSEPAEGEDPELSAERDRELDEILATITDWESTALAQFDTLEHLAWSVYVVHFVLVRLQRLLRRAAQLGAHEADDAVVREVDPLADCERVAEDFRYAVEARSSAAVQEDMDFDTETWAAEVLALDAPEFKRVRAEFLEAMKRRATFLGVRKTLSIVVMDQTYGIGMGPEDEEHVFLVAWMDPYGHFASGSAEQIDAEIDAALDLVACRLVTEGWRPGMSIEDAAQAHRRAEERANLAMLDNGDSAVRDLWRAAPKLIARLPRRELAPLADLRQRFDVPAGSLMILPLDWAEAKVYDPEDRFAFAFRLPDGKGFMFTLGELADPEDLDDMRDPSRLWDWGGEGDWNSPALVLASGLDWVGVARILGLEPPSFQEGALNDSSGQ